MAVKVPGRREILGSGAVRPAAVGVVIVVIVVAGGAGGAVASHLEEGGSREGAGEGHCRRRGEPGAINGLEDLRRHLGVFAGGSLRGPVAQYPVDGADARDVGLGAHTWGWEEDVGAEGGGW